MKLEFKSFLLFIIISLTYTSTVAQTSTVFSPDKNLKVSIFLSGKKPVYTVEYKGMLDASPLGFTTNEGQFTERNYHFFITYDESYKRFCKDNTKLRKWL